jgi:hypothetical protein
MMSVSTGAEDMALTLVYCSQEDSFDVIFEEEKLVDAFRGKIEVASAANRSIARNEVRRKLPSGVPSKMAPFSNRPKRVQSSLIWLILM